MRKVMVGVLLLIITIFIFQGLFHKSGPETFLNYYLNNLKNLNAANAYHCIVYENGVSEPFEHFKENITNNPLTNFTIQRISKSDDASFSALVAMTFEKENGEAIPSQITYTLMKRNNEWKLVFPEYKIKTLDQWTSQ